MTKTTTLYTTAVKITQVIKRYYGKSGKEIIQTILEDCPDLSVEQIIYILNELTEGYPGIDIEERLGNLSAAMHNATPNWLQLAVKVAEIVLKWFTGDKAGAISDAIQTTYDELKEKGELR